MVQIKKKTENICRHKVGTYVNIAIFVRLWKPRITGAVLESLSLAQEVTCSNTKCLQKNSTNSVDSSDHAELK